MSIFTKQDFLGCHDCELLQAVVHESGLHLDEAAEEAVLAYREFIAGHAGHRIAEFHRRTAEVHSDRPLWDPMASITFEVTDGHEEYLAHSTRATIDEPRVYRFTRGCLQVQSTEIAVDDRDVRRGLDLEFYPHALRPTKLDRFVSVLRQVVSHINPDELAIAFDAADDPAVSVAPMPDVISQALLAQCEEIFDPWEFSRISSFVHNNRDEHGLLALRVHRQLSQLTA